MHYSHSAWLLDGRTSMLFLSNIQVVNFSPSIYCIIEIIIMVHYLPLLSLPLYYTRLIKIKILKGIGIDWIHYSATKSKETRIRSWH